MKGINKLNKDVLSFLFLRVDIKSIYNLLVVDKKINKILYFDLFWMNKILSDYKDFGHGPKNILQNHKDLTDNKLFWKKYYYVLFCILNEKYETLIMKNLDEYLPSVVVICNLDTRLYITGYDNSILKDICFSILKNLDITSITEIPHIKCIKKILSNDKVSSLIIKGDIKEYSSVAQILLYDNILSNKK